MRERTEWKKWGRERCCDEKRHETAVSSDKEQERLGEKKPRETQLTRRLFKKRQLVKAGEHIAAILEKKKQDSASRYNVKQSRYYMIIFTL